MLPGYSKSSASFGESVMSVETFLESRSNISLG